MELAYDFHLHSCLSPCGDEDMTPYNLINMARILELDIVALTDHNTCGNCRSAVEVGNSIGLTVVPGMELCTAEEIHVVCLFPDCDKADAFAAYVRSTMPPIPNKQDVFGRQLLMDVGDGITGEEPLLLVAASGIGINGLPRLVAEHGGFCYPAHIDRASFSILSSLGTINKTMGFTCAEISSAGDTEELCRRFPDLREMRILRSSDAHYLENMREASDRIHLPENTAPALIAYLKGKTYLNGGPSIVL